MPIATVTRLTALSDIFDHELVVVVKNNGFYRTASIETVDTEIDKENFLLYSRAEEEDIFSTVEFGREYFRDLTNF